MPEKRPYGEQPQGDPEPGYGNRDERCPECGMREGHHRECSRCNTHKRYKAYLDALAEKHGAPKPNRYTPSAMAPDPTEER